MVNVLVSKRFAVFFPMERAQYRPYYNYYNEGAEGVNPQPVIINRNKLVANRMTVFLGSRSIESESYTSILVLVYYM